MCDAAVLTLAFLPRFSLLGPQTRESRKYLYIHHLSICHPYGKRNTNCYIYRLKLLFCMNFGAILPQWRNFGMPTGSFGPDTTPIIA